MLTLNKKILAGNGVIVKMEGELENVVGKVGFSGKKIGRIVKTGAVIFGKKFSVNFFFSQNLSFVTTRFF